MVKKKKKKKKKPSSDLRLLPQICPRTLKKFKVTCFRSRNQKENEDEVNAEDVITVTKKFFHRMDVLECYPLSRQHVVLFAEWF